MTLPVAGTRLLSNLAIGVTLYRSAGRALFVRAGSRPEDLPSYVLKWLGEVESIEEAEFSETTPMIGISAAAVMYDLIAHGYCLVEPDSAVAAGQSRSTA